MTAGIRRVVYTEAEIRQRVIELGGSISTDYAGRNPLLVGVLKGVMFFMTDLLRAITIPVSVDFMAISRYKPQIAGRRRRAPDQGPRRGGGGTAT